MNTRKKNLRINRQGRQKITRSLDLLTPRRSPNSALRYTHRSSALLEGPLGGRPFLSLTTKGSWIDLWGRVVKPLVSSLTPEHPPPLIHGKCQLAN